MNEERFFKGLLASLRLQGARFVDTRGNRHQFALAAALDLLEQLRADGTPGTDEMPRALLPGPVTGTYSQFDDALVSLQKKGYDAAQNPYYPAVTLTITQSRARHVLSRFSESQRSLLSELSTEFLRHQPAETHTRSA